MSILSKIDLKQIKFPVNQYYREKTDKLGICIHHTVSGAGISGDVSWWKSKPSRIATALIIDRDGVAWQLFYSRYWGHHLGIKKRVFIEHGIPTRKNGIDRNVWLNKSFIGIELDSWGILEKVGNKFYAKGYRGDNALVPNKDAVVYPELFRGFKYFERYTNKQIKTLLVLLRYFNEVYKLNMTYYDYMWRVTKKALRGELALSTHVSYREDKWDAHPQIELINALHKEF